MKRTILLFTAIAGFSAVTLTSYVAGPAAPPPTGGGLNVTGGPGSSGTCANNGCHGAQTANTQVNWVNMLEKPSMTPVTSYKSGKTYTITISGVNPNLTNYGFQLEAIYASGPLAGQQAGGLIGTNPQHTTRTVGGITLLEHNQMISAISGLAVSFDWLAPTTGDPVVFHAVVNAVNGDTQADPGDEPSMSFSHTVAHDLSVPDLSEKIRITAYPNPVQDQFSLKFEDADNGSYTVSVFDMMGRTVSEEEVKINHGQGTLPINTSNWASGTYLTRIMKDGAQRVIVISK